MEKMKEKIKVNEIITNNDKNKYKTLKASVYLVYIFLLLGDFFVRYYAKSFLW